MTRLLLSVFSAGLCAVWDAGAASVWRIGRVASSDQAITAGTQIVLNSAEIDRDRLLLRVFYQGTLGRSGPVVTPPMAESDAVLKVEGEGSPLACISLDKPWSSGSAMTLSPGEKLAATLCFHAPAGLAEKNALLCLSGYDPISFRCTNGTAATLPDLSETPERWDLNETIDPILPGFDHVALQLGTMRLWENRLTFVLSFRNTSRAPFTMTNCPPGGAATLVSAEREFFRKPEVTGAIAKQIAPEGIWRPGAVVTGTVTFPLPHPHGQERLFLSFPGYPDVPLIFDESLHRWRVEKENMQRRWLPLTQLRVRAEEQLFQSVSRFWTEVSRRLERREFAACAALFESPGECALLKNIDKIPLAAIDVRPAPAQQLVMQGDELVGVRMEVRFRYRGEPETSSFLLVGGCRMKRAAGEAGWRVSSLTLDLAPPWAQGYTAFGESGHFLLFYRPEGGRVEEAMAVLEQLENSWETISATGLKLAPRYAAFLCLAQEDHKLLTGDRSVATADASVSGVALDEGDRFRTYNVAVYVTSEVFRGFSPLQIRRRLQAALDHELVHAALSPWTRAWMPGWLVEGVAVHLSGERRGSRAELAQAFASGMNLRALTETGVLRDPRGDLVRINLQYLIAAEAVAFIASNWGVDRLMELYRAWSLEYPEAWRGPYGADYGNETSPAKRQARLELTRKLLKQVLGTSIEELDSAVRNRAL